MNIPSIVRIALPVLFLFIVLSCKKKDEPDPDPVPVTRYVIFKYRFDSTQARLDNLGNPSTIPVGNSALSPVFHQMSAHYIELARNESIALGSGKVVYHAPETTLGGSTAIDFSRSVKKGQGEEFFRYPISGIPAGTYKYLRVSLAYQNYDIKFKSGSYYGTGRLASFVGYNTYISSYVIDNESVVVNGNRLQGYWGFETNVLGTPYVSSGQAPPGATTVPNPIASTSPIPAGSCVVTGMFSPSPLIITGTETNDIVITVSLSTNKSFEWKDANSDGWFEPAAGDTVVDMGLRGLVPIVN